MAWQYEVGSGSNRATTYRDFATKAVAFMTSQHVATVAVNSGGTGYTLGDILTLTHAGAYLDARFEVTGVSAGVITSLRIVAAGAFSNRIATVAVNAGGTGYAVNDVLEVQGGTSREKGKAQVTTVSGGVVTGVALFETGGAYSTAPGLTGAATVGVGPSTFAGDDACTLNLTMTGLIGTTGLSVTGGTGTGATVNITLAQTGWAVDSRNRNDVVVNSVDFEKQVSLVGDATGFTNKPYVHLQTGTFTSGVNTRYWMTVYMSLAHNPAIALESQVGISPGVPNTFVDGGPYLLFDENQAQQMDFWLSCNDRRIVGVLNTNSGAATTDDGEYHHWHAGFLDTFATETEDPYPAYVFASSRQRGADPSPSNQNITGLSEQASPSGGNPGSFFFRSEDSSWIAVENSEGLVASQIRTTIMFPIGRVSTISQPTSTSDNICADGPLVYWSAFGALNRSVATNRLRPIPGTTAQHYPIPLTIIHRAGGTSVNQVLDTVRGQVSGVFHVFATDGTGATITNFSEDYITIGTDRYRVFANHVQKQLYNYICIKED